MNSKLIASILLTGGLLASGTASAIPWSWTGTIASWASEGGNTGVITDGDNDAKFTLFNTTSIPTTSTVNISEVEVGGKDYYDVGIGWGPDGYVGGGQLAYTIEVIGGGNEQITSAALDTVITGTGTTAIKILRDLPSNSIFLNLSSFDGAKDPVTGYAEFAGRTLIGVQDVFQPSTSGLFQDAHNSFTTSVPEPMSLSLFGVGLAGLLLSRRRKV